MNKTAFSLNNVLRLIVGFFTVGLSKDTLAAKQVNLGDTSQVIKVPLQPGDKVKIVDHPDHGKAVANQQDGVIIYKHDGSGHNDKLCYAIYDKSGQEVSRANDCEQGAAETNASGIWSLLGIAGGGLTAFASNSGRSKVSPEETTESVRPMMISEDSFIGGDEQEFVVKLTAQDPDTPDDDIMFAITGGPDANDFIIDASGNLLFSPPADAGEPQDEDMNNEYIVEVTPSDETGAGAPQTITVTIEGCSLIVDTTNDGNDVGTLRSAIDCANMDADEDTIFLGAGTYKISEIGDDDSNVDGDFDVTEDLIIQGLGKNATYIDAADIDRIFDIHNGATLTLKDLSIINGSPISGVGGGVFLSGGDTSLITENVIFTGNKEGGIVANGFARVEINNTTLFNNAQGGLSAQSGDELLIQDSIFSNNYQVFNGVGISSGSVTTTTIDNTTVTYNSSTLGGHGGGILFSNTDFNVTNTTLSHNSNRVGGGLTSGIGGDGELVNTTFYSNDGDIGGGIRIQNDSQIDIYNSTLTNDMGIGISTTTIFGPTMTNLESNLLSFATGFDLSENFTTSGHNLIGTIAPGTIITDNDPGDTDLPFGTDPLIVSFGNFGGDVYTTLLLESSPAINSGSTNASSLATDARGAPRVDVDSGMADIGSMELNFDSLESLVGSANDDTIIGGDNDNSAEGMAGDDVFELFNGDDMADGGLGNDYINAGGGADILIGGGGADTLRGAFGNDILTGNDGEDVFYMDTHSGTDIVETDVITDWEDGIDKIDIGWFTNILQHFDTTITDAKITGSEFATFITGIDNGFIKVAITPTSIILNNNQNTDGDLIIDIGDTSMLTEDDFLWL